MGRAPCCSKVGLHRGPWTSKEDSLLTNYITSHGEGHWRSLPKQAGLLRCGKSCRLRWMNYLRPDIKRGNITAQEDDLIIRLHSLLGNRWSLIAGRLPGRTDNEIKNYWNTRLSKKITPPSSRSPSKNITIKRKSPNKKANSASPPADLEIIETKHMVHQPKPVRLGSVRNMSSLVQTSESNNNNNNSTNIECSSFSSENNMNFNSNYYYNSNASCNSEEAGDKQQVDHHVADLEVAALYNNNNIGSSDDIIGAWDDDDDDMYNGLYGDQAFNAVNNNNRGVWEKLYEEYLQLTNDGCEVESHQPHEASLFI